MQPTPLRIVATAALVASAIGDTGRSADAAPPAAEVVDLPVEGHRPAVAVVPDGARPRPVIVAAHGREDRAAPLCETLGALVEGRAFVLCPRGIRTGSGASTYASADALAEEIDDALVALRAHFPERVDPGPYVYFGFSLGAYQGVRVLLRDPTRTPRAILVEGGEDPWDARAIRAYARGGGQRILFATGQAENERRAREVAEELEDVGVAARVVHAPGAGHVYGGDVGERIAAAFDWLVAGDERFSP